MSTMTFHVSSVCWAMAEVDKTVETCRAISSCAVHENISIGEGGESISEVVNLFFFLQP